MEYITIVYDTICTFKFLDECRYEEEISDYETAICDIYCPTFSILLKHALL